MKLSLLKPSNPIIWQVIWQALDDYANDPQPQTSYCFDTPIGDVEVMIRKLPNEVKVTWRIK